MKTRFVILLSFVLLIVACAKDNLPAPEEETPHPAITLESPNLTFLYKAGEVVPIKGEIIDPEKIKALSFIVYRDVTANDTVFKKSLTLDNLSYTFDEVWTPQTLDFTNSENTYLLEIKVTHAPASAQPHLSFFQEVRVYR